MSFFSDVGIFQSSLSRPLPSSSAMTAPSGKNVQGKLRPPLDQRSTALSATMSSGYSPKAWKSFGTIRSVDAVARTRREDGTDVCPRTAAARPS
jgi:hypothetical protein